MKTIKITKVAVLVTLLSFVSASPNLLSQDAATTTTDQGQSRGQLNKSTGELNAEDARFIREAAKGAHMEVRLGQLGRERAQNSSVRQLADRLVTDHTLSNQELMQLAARKGISLPRDPSAQGQGGTSGLSTSGQSTTGQSSSERIGTSQSESSTSGQTGTTTRDQSALSSDRPSSGTSTTGQSKSGAGTGSGTTSGQLSDSSDMHQSMQRLQSLSGQEFDRVFTQHVIKAHQQGIAKYEKAASECQDADVKAFASKSLPTLREHLRMAQAIPLSGTDTGSGTTPGSKSSTGTATGTGTGTSSSDQNRKEQ